MYSINAKRLLPICFTSVYNVLVLGKFGSFECKVRNACTILLYVALLAIAVYCGVISDWLDFYYASLWILCFFIVELNTLKYETDTEEQALLTNS